MKILVIGDGGREHALVWKFAQSKHKPQIFAAPGSDAIAEYATCVPIAVENIEALADWAYQKNIDLTMVGPELPLTLGVVDAFQQRGLKIFGPTAAAAALEGSKAFAKDLMEQYGIPTARYKKVDSREKAKAALRDFALPVVLKIDGLAAGKGVYICNTAEEAEGALSEIFVQDNSVQIVIEEFLEGEEVSILALCDGTSALPLASSQDHKRIFDGDQGPNTGGMGAYSPVPCYSDAIADYVEKEILQKTLMAMQKEGKAFTGILYAGLMLTPDGPKVLEFNVRFGDPETQPLLYRLETDLVDILNMVLDGDLKKIHLQWNPNTALCVVMASNGYPHTSSKGDPIMGLEEAAEHGMVFHAGTKKNNENTYCTNGGRVLGVTGLGKDVREARKNVYAAVDCISFSGMQYRKDIGAKALGDA